MGRNPHEQYIQRQQRGSHKRHELPHKSKYDTDLAAKEKALTDFKAEVESKEKASAKTAALESALLKAGANSKYVKKIIRDVEVDKLKMDGGTIKDIDKVIEGVKGEWGDLFGKVED